MVLNSNLLSWAGAVAGVAELLGPAGAAIGGVVAWQLGLAQASIGSRAFLVMGNTNTGVDQLCTGDGYAVPFIPVVTIRQGAFEI